MAVWKPKPAGVIEDGFYEATIKSVTPVGNKKTQFGVKKDWHDFVFRIERSDGEFREVKHGMPLSIERRANFLKLLVALDVAIKEVQRNGIDPENFVGMTCNVRVYNDKGHSGIEPLPPTPVTAEQVTAAENKWRSLPDNMHEDYEWFRAKHRKLEMRFEKQQARARGEV